MGRPDRISYPYPWLCLDEAVAPVLTPDSERIVALGKAAEVVAACEALRPDEGGEIRGLRVEAEPGAARAESDAPLARLKALLVEPLALPEEIRTVLVSPEGALYYTLSKSSRRSHISRERAPEASAAAGGEEGEGAAGSRRGGGSASPAIKTARARPAANRVAGRARAVLRTVGGLDGVGAPGLTESSSAPFHIDRGIVSLRTMRISEELIREVVRRILSVAEPDRIILFGSAATGAAGPHSDIDLLVLEPNVSEARSEWSRIDEALQDLGVPVDVLIMKTRRFEETKDLVGGIAYPAARYGQVIYAVA
jgi:predicted nucleotidyltransferase